MNKRNLNELIFAKKEIAFQIEEKKNRAAELMIANEELAFQNQEKKNRAAELVIANKELAFQNQEKRNRAAELVIANKELAFQNNEKENRADELILANIELAFQNNEKGNRAAELMIANLELAFQNEEKGKRAAELSELNQQLKEKERQLSNQINAITKSNATIEFDLNGIITDVSDNFLDIMGYSKNEVLGRHHIMFVGEEYAATNEYHQFWESLKKGEYKKDEFKRINKKGEFVWLLGSYNPILDISGKPFKVLKIATDISLVRKQMLELAQQSEEKEKRGAELIIANKELAFQNEEKEKRAAELGIASKELNHLDELLQSNLKEMSDYKYALDEATIIAITDKKGLIKKVNPNFCKISKYNEDELIGQDHRIINSGYHSKEFFLDFWLTIAKGKIWKGEVKNKAKDGTFYWVDTTIVPFLSEQGKPYQYLAIRVDITDRKEAEEIVIQRTDQLGIANKELAFQNDEKENRASELAIANKELAFQNNEKENRAAELMIANLELAFQNEEKEKRAADLVILSENLTFQQEESRRANELLIKQEEKVKIINHELLQLNQELEERVTNRTKALVESETRFRNMMETIPQIAWTNTVEGEVTFYNQRWFDYTGLDREQSKTWKLQTVIHPDDLKSALDQYRSIKETSDGGEFQIRGKRADGLYRWHLIRLMPIKNEEGQLQLWVGTATDIQELKLLQQQKDDFISIAGHELKTPLTGLKASLQLLNRMKDNPSLTMLPNLIVQANKSLDKAIVLIDDLLNASKMNEGQLHLNQKRFVISKVIDDCCPHIRSEGIYTIITEGDLEVEVFADEGRIDQIVINFVNNAIKYAPESKKIHIKIEKVNDMVKVSVIDKGPGISPEKLPHLFDRYYRVDHSGSQYSGLGLGLYICAEIIKKHKGQIGVDSEMGKGSTFWFTLPVVQKAARSYI